MAIYYLLLIAQFFAINCSAFLKKIVSMTDCHTLALILFKMRKEKKLFVRREP